MHAMVGRRSSQLKMPRPDAYETAALLVLSKEVAAIFNKGEDE